MLTTRPNQASFLAVLGLVCCLPLLMAQEKPAKPKGKSTKTESKPGMTGSKSAKSKGTPGKPTGNVAAARARMLAPFVNADTFAVGHLDATRIDVHDLITRLGARFDV